MDTERIVIDRKQALELYRKYKIHQHYSQPIDKEIQRTYQLIAQGRVVIKALESIKQAGLNEQGLPKLAIARADMTRCHLRLQNDGGAIMAKHVWARDNGRTRIEFPPDTFSRADRGHYSTAEAIVPIVPIHLRPKRAITAYHILWEAEWARIIPRDPMLLRRFGKGDLWLVVAVWDLTEVERAAMAARLNA